MAIVTTATLVETRTTSGHAGSHADWPVNSPSVTIATVRRRRWRRRRRRAKREANRAPAEATSGIQDTFEAVHARAVKRFVAEGQRVEIAAHAIRLDNHGQRAGFDDEHHGFAADRDNRQRQQKRCERDGSRRRETPTRHRPSHARPGRQAMSDLRRRAPQCQARRRRTGTLTASLLERLDREIDQDDRPVGEDEEHAACDGGA